VADVETKDELLTKLVKNFDTWFDATQSARSEAMEARDYYDGYQWTEEEQSTLKARKQPVLTDNKLKDKIDYMIGMEINARTDPKAFPRTPKHEQDAEAITDALRYVGDSQDFPKVRSDIAENIFVEGMGGDEVYVKNGKDGVDVCIKRNRFERCYWDPHSSERDFSDSRYLGTFVWMDLEEAQDKWPDLSDIWNTTAGEMRTGTMGESDSDRPQGNLHIDRAKSRVRVLEQYYLKGKVWYRAKFVKNGWIDEPEPSPYLNDEGDPEHPYSWGSAYVDKDNNRYGVIRRWKSLQDEINHRRSKSLHLLNTNQVIMEDGAVQDVQKLKLELAKPDGVITRTPGMELEVNKNLDLSAGHFQMMQQAIEALSIVGPKAITNVSASQSGRAKQLDRQSDALELGRLFDHLRHLQKVTYRKVWHRIKQYWTEEKWVRVRDDEGAPKFVQLNAPVTAQDMVQTAQQRGIEIHPMLAQIHAITPTRTMAVRNNVAELDVDIIIDEMPDVISLQEEQFANLVTLAQAGVIFPPDVYIDASQLRNKKAAKEKLSGGDDPAAQQAAAINKQMEDRMKVAAVTKMEAEGQKIGQEAVQTEIENAAGIAALGGMATGQ
jgi:hypothetical protein